MVLPRYGDGALADVVPSVLAGLGVVGESDVFGLPEARRVCVLLVDGLGWHLLAEHGDAAPFLASLAAGREPITAGFPSTTATSLAAVGTGMPTGEHGLVGYTFAVSDGELLNVLGWNRHATGLPADLRDQQVPERVQPKPTAFERATQAGVAVRVVAPRSQRDSGLTRAALRGGEFAGVYAMGDLATSTVDALRSADRVLCYAYHADLDLLGHVYGPGTEAWRAQLAQVDRLAEQIAGRLPSGGLLLVTADHGMVSVAEPDRIDFDTHPHLPDGVAMLGGEARARYVYTEPGATPDVAATWREVLGERAWIRTRAEAIDAGWFGPDVPAQVRDRIGDVVVAARGHTAVVRSATERRLSRFAGQHGSLTAAEQHIPLLPYRPR
ncbi:MAG TPA: nucleotide pyrophosphatase/phosphodiesterase family protein [Mycobacteriales bacterium]|nr:nucleotide pyrophosphatase/phosphodiesterase family protein [Mycobacteriales bacterium]